MVFARASASCWPTRRCDHCRMCWDDLWVKHDLFFWGWKSSQFGHEIRHCIRQMVRFAETSGFGANNSQATRKNLQITSDQGLRSVRSCNSWTLEVALSGQRSGDMTGAWPRGGLAARQSGWIHIRIGHRSCKKWFHITIQSYCWALHFTILLPISQRHLMLETLSIPSCIERAMTFSGLGSGGSFLCWASMLMGASIARAPGSCSQRTGQEQLLIFAGGVLRIAACIYGFTDFCMSRCLIPRADRYRI